MNLLSKKISQKNDSFEEIQVRHTYNDSQIDWFKYGSALNKIKAQNL